jgi:hypothetical protein
MIGCSPREQVFLQLIGARSQGDQEFNEVCLDNGFLCHGDAVAKANQFFRNRHVRHCISGVLSIEETLDSLQGSYHRLVMIRLRQDIWSWEGFKCKAKNNEKEDCCILRTDGRIWHGFMTMQRRQDNGIAVLERRRNSSKNKLPRVDIVLNMAFVSEPIPKAEWLTGKSTSLPRLEWEKSNVTEVSFKNSVFARMMA